MNILIKRADEDGEMDMNKGTCQPRRGLDGLHVDRKSVGGTQSAGWIESRSRDRECRYNKSKDYCGKQESVWRRYIQLNRSHQRFYNATPTAEEVRLVVLAFLVRVNELGATRREPEVGGGNAMRLLGGVVVTASMADPADFR